MDTRPITTIESKQNKPSIFKFITSPAVEMEKIKQKPAIWLPLVFTMLLGIIAGVISAYTPSVIRMIEEQQAGTGIPLESMQIFTVIMAVIGVLIATPIILLIRAAIMLAVAKIFKGQGTFKSYFSVSVFILFITNIGLFLNALIAYIVDGQPNFTSLNGIVNATGSTGNLLNNIEIFTIWVSILTGVAFYKIANLSKGISIALGIAAFILTFVIAALSGGVQ